MLKTDIGGCWLEPGQKVVVTAKNFAGQTGILRGFDHLRGNYIVQMEVTVHVLPFLLKELADPADGTGSP